MFSGGLAPRPSLTAGRSQSARLSRNSSSNNDHNFAPPPRSSAQSNAGSRSRSTHWMSSLPAKSVGSNNGVGVHPRQSAGLRNGSMPPPSAQSTGYNNNSNGNNAGLTNGHGNGTGPSSPSSAGYVGGSSSGVLSRDGVGGVYTGNGGEDNGLDGGFGRSQQHIPVSSGSGISAGGSFDVASGPEQSVHRKAYSLPGALNLTSQALSRLDQVRRDCEGGKHRVSFFLFHSSPHPPLSPSRFPFFFFFSNSSFLSATLDTRKIRARFLVSRWTTTELLVRFRRRQVLCAIPSH